MIREEVYKLTMCIILVFHPDEGQRSWWKRRYNNRFYLLTVYNYVVSSLADSNSSSMIEVRSWAKK